MECIRCGFVTPGDGTEDADFNLLCEECENEYDFDNPNE